MKPTILTTIILFCCISFSQAQGIHAGFKVGSTINKISGKSFKDEFTYGYHAGAFLQIGLGSRWSIQPEVLYNQVNTDTTDRFSELYKLSANKISNIKLSYLTVPVLLNYNLGSNFALQAGPQFGILLDQNRNLLENGKDAFSKGDFSMLGGVQIKLSSLRIYGRYAIGLNNLNDIDNKDTWKNQAIQLGIGLSLF
jgi:hypothetical protein